MIGIAIFLIVLFFASFNLCFHSVHILCFLIIQLTKIFLQHIVSEGWTILFSCHVTAGGRYAFCRFWQNKKDLKIRTAPRHHLHSGIFPICRPILVTVAIIQVFSCWNEFSFALVLIKDVSLQTVPLALTQFKGQFASDYPKQMAAMLITMAPVVVLYFAFSKEIIKGMVSGAVKG